MHANQNFKQSLEQSNFDFFHELSKDLWSHIHGKNDHENSIFSKFDTSLEEDSAFWEYLHSSLALVTNPSELDEKSFGLAELFGEMDEMVTDASSLKKVGPEFQNYVTKH